MASNFPQGSIGQSPPTLYLGAVLKTFKLLVHISLEEGDEWRIAGEIVYECSNLKYKEFKQKCGQEQL